MRSSGLPTTTLSTLRGIKTEKLLNLKMTLEQKLARTEFADIFRFELTSANTLTLDLSDENSDEAFVKVNSVGELEKYIWDKMASEGKQFAIGGYGENRVIYKRFTHFNSGETEERSIHLGSDLWCDAHEPLFAPLSGTVHSFKNNDNPGDYGGTIILEHNLEGIKFYTLYGHLSWESLSGLKKGQEIQAGKQFATLGAEAENGGWPPHLHFQVMKDLEGREGDYPGVAEKSKAEKFLANCPDPKYMLGLR